ncbi:MAG: hypothetical protein OXR66_03395 [Candidatus Woesearchaeota archaeon]|nr:hypothetical protein [Candidatus Woesearchaeota archaeon]
MGRRWVYLVVAVFALCLALPVLAHKFPIIEYTYVGHIWEEAYTMIPRQPVVDENIIIKAWVKHPNETIEGNVTSVFAVYQDRTYYEWFGGKAYKNPDWLLMKEAYGAPTENHDEFETDIVIEQQGSYMVTVDWYENRQYIGQSMHTLDIETRTLGPMFIIFNIVLILGVLIGVKAGVLT